jgi:hypothetical protein
MNDDPIVFVVAALIHAARVAAGAAASQDIPHAFDVAEAFVAEAKKRGIVFPEV